MVVPVFRMPTMAPCVVCAVPTYNRRHGQPVCMAEHEDTVKPEVIPDIKTKDCTGPCCQALRKKSR